MRIKEREAGFSSATPPEDAGAGDYDGIEFPPPSRHDRSLSRIIGLPPAKALQSESMISPSKKRLGTVRGAAR